MPSHALPPSVGRYEVEALLGAGGMGQVYLARDPALGRQVAVKVLLASLGGDGGARTRFEREIRAAMALSHPNIVRLLDVGTAADGSLFYVMEHVDGQDLAVRIDEGRRTPVAEVERLAGQVLGALEALHERGMVHRDVKPGNVMVDRGGRVVLMDFGLVRHDDLTALTSDGEVVGTLRYLAPETLEGDGATARSDVYQVGLMALALATGSEPWGHLEGMEHLYRHILGGVDELLLRPEARELTPSFVTWVGRACATEPDDRFPTAAAAAAALGGERAAGERRASRVRGRPRQSTARLAAVTGESPSTARHRGPSTLRRVLFVVSLVVAAVLVGRLLVGSGGQVPSGGQRAAPAETAAARVGRLRGLIDTARPRALAERLHDLILDGRVAEARELAFEARRREPLRTALEELATDAGSLFASVGVPFDEKHALYLRLTDLEAVDAVFQDVRLPGPLEAGKLRAQWLPLVYTQAQPEGQVVVDGFSSPTILTLLDARSKVPSLMDGLFITGYFSGAAYSSELVAEAEVDPEALARARRVDLSVWVNAVTPADEVRVAVNGRELIVRTDDSVEPGSDLTPESIARLLREHRPDPCSFPVVATVPKGYLQPGRNGFRFIYRSAAPMREMFYVVPLDVRLRLVEE